MADIMVSTLSFPEESLNEGIKEVEPFLEFLHIDIMDGKFVENKTCGVEILKKISTKMKIDVHLMVKDARKAIRQITNVHSVNFHYEACKNFAEAVEIIEAIKLKGIKAGIVINPETPISRLKEILPFADQVLVMSVHPGKGGQKFMPEALDKIRALRKMRKDLIIEVDGGIKLDNAKKIADAGADRLVVGSAIATQKNIGEAVEEFRKAISKT